MSVVYQHRIKNTKKVFYIGIGKDVSRAYSMKNRNAYWLTIAKNIGYEVDILIKNIPHEIAMCVERDMIISYGKIVNGNGFLVNLTDGGQGALGYKHSKQSLEKISGKNNHKFNKGYMQAGEKNPMYGKKGILSHTFGKTGYKNHKSKEVFQYDIKTKELIKSFGSTRDAQRETKINCSSISQCCNNHPNYTHAGGYIWKYN